MGFGVLESQEVKASTHCTSFPCYGSTAAVKMTIFFLTLLKVERVKYNFYEPSKYALFVHLNQLLPECFHISQGCAFTNDSQHTNCIRTKHSIFCVHKAAFTLEVIPYHTIGA